MNANKKERDATIWVSIHLQYLVRMVYRIDPKRGAWAYMDREWYMTRGGCAHNTSRVIPPKHADIKPQTTHMMGWSPIWTPFCVPSTAKAASPRASAKQIGNAESFHP